MGVAGMKSGSTGFNIHVFPFVLKLYWNTFKRSNSAFIASPLNEGQLLKKRIFSKNGGQLVKEFALP